MLRRKLNVAFNVRFDMLKRELYQLLIKDDAFGLKSKAKPLAVFNITGGDWRMLNDERKLEALKQWLKFRTEQLFLKHAQDDSAQTWLGEYVKQAYERGLKRSYDDWGKPTDVMLLPEKVGAVYQQGGLAEFMRQSYGGPVPLERVRFLATRVYDGLEGITERLGHQITRTMLDGMTSGISPRDIGTELNKIVGGYKNRGAAIARTEIVRAFNEGALDGYEKLGAKSLAIMVEWTTSGLGRTALGNPSPCEKCAPLANLVLTVDEARGLLPRHPNCLCSYVPANVGEKSDKQIRDAERIRAAIKRSAEGDSRWLGAHKKISSKRPKVVS